MLDPDLRVGSKGCRYLQDHGITVIVVEEVRDEIEELNHSFIAHKLVPQLLGTPEAKTAERITNRATLSFIDDLNPDPHDLTSFVELFARGEAVTPKIRWSTVNDRVLVQAIKDKIAYVQQIRLAATGAGNQPSIAHIQADWLQLVDGVINRAIAIRSRAARRIPLMWTGMRGFWRQHTPDAFLEARELLQEVRGAVGCAVARSCRL